MTKDYANLNKELEDILQRLQDESTPLDESIELYEKGIDVIKKLKQYLKKAENKLNLISKNFEDEE